MSTNQPKIEFRKHDYKHFLVYVNGEYVGWFDRCYHNPGWGQGKPYVYFDGRIKMNGAYGDVRSYNGLRDMKAKITKMLTVSE